MVHAYILRTGFKSDLLVFNNLLHVYITDGLILEALKLFYKMPERDVVSWNTMISGLVGSGFIYEGFSIYREMRRVGIIPSQSSFASVLVALTEMGSLVNCRQIHGECFKYGFFSNLLVGNALLTAYVKCGDIKGARDMFDGMKIFDEASCEILLRGYLQLGSFSDAFDIFRSSHLVGIPVSCFALTSLISFCGSSELIDNGMQIHGYIVKVRLDSDVSVVNSLIAMYARSYLLEEATYLFEGLSCRDIVTWNSLIAGYALNSEGDIGMGLVGRLLSTGMRMNESTFSSFLSSSTTLTVLESAKKAHVLILKLSESIDQVIINIILTMYCRCKSLSYASKVFEVMERDMISFNLLTGLFRDLGQHGEAIRLFWQCRLEGFNMDELMYSSLISSCSKLAALEIGEPIHSCIIKTGFEKVLLLRNSLLEMYSQCSKLKSMEKIFSEIDGPDIFTWNTMIMGYACFGCFDQAIKIWEKMIELSIELNEFSYCTMLDICGYLEDSVTGEHIQAQIQKLGLFSDTSLMNSLLTMYASCGLMDKASKIFKEIPWTDSVSWNAIVCGYAQNGFTEESLRFYMLMNENGLRPNHMTFASIFKSCATCTDLKVGLQFHAQVIIRGFESYILVSNSFINLYAKCGDINDSSRIFQNTINYRDVITWNSMICGYAYHGCGREALDTLSDMKTSGKRPNYVTFIGVLSACSHAGLVTEAEAIFKSMYSDYGIVPCEEHYACMVDILCRAGNLREAKDLIESMPFRPCSLIWRTLLSACRNNENIQLGKEVAEKIMQLEPLDTSAYILLSNIYASVEKMEEKAEMRRRMKDMKVKKETGYSWIWS
ncbi:pentatricopeptide repeat-containing protein At4g13650-like [Telopea speciosissima]|uniref:pentatricopeptide repeat-containing protein At4g13650-like n=1 Tax=Telopea speciosissima TaxID=54955 RepID=UPI001CC34A08|nr:pentatricopeptide repeat-containing protein At4g13650-like [Telopea speciosissima]